MTRKRVDAASGVRPVLIIQNDKGNTHSDSYIAALITSQPKKNLPTHFKLGKEFGLERKSTVLCEHLVTIKQNALIRYIGTIAGSAKEEEKLDKALKVSLQL